MNSSEKNWNKTRGTLCSALANNPCAFKMCMNEGKEFIDKNSPYPPYNQPYEWNGYGYGTGSGYYYEKPHYWPWWNNEQVVADNPITYIKCQSDILKKYDATGNNYMSVLNKYRKEYTDCCVNNCSHYKGQDKLNCINSCMNVN